MEIPLTIPFIFWNKNAEEPEHKISCLARRSDLIVTGSLSGELIIWKTENDSYTPSIICSTGKKSKCLSLCFISGPVPELVGSHVLIVSLHNDNKIRLWDSIDGRCTSSSSSSLLPALQFNQVISVRDQFLAVSGCSPEILIIDSWSMEKIGSYLMSGNIVKTQPVPIGFWAADNNECLGKFEIPLQVPFYLNTSTKISIDNHSNFMYNIREEIEDFCVSLEYDIIVVKLKAGIRVFLFNWIEEDRKEYFHMDDPEIIKIFCADELILLKDLGYIKIDLRSLRKSVMNKRENFISKSNSLTNIRVHSMKNFINHNQHPVDSIFIHEFTQDFIYGFKENAIYVTDRKESFTKKNVFSFKSISFECFADMNLHCILADGETITCSLAFLTADWPIYIIGTSLGKILLNHFQPFQPVQQFIYHTAPITCIYIKGEKMVTCCKAHTMCIWDINLAKTQAPESENQFSARSNRRSLPLLRSSNLTAKEVVQNRPVQKIEFYFGSIRRILRVDGIREDKPLESTDLLVGQSKDFSVILVSLSSGQLLGFFHPISGFAQEAYLLNTMDYLYIISEDNELFVFNINSNVQERIITGDDVNPVTRRPNRSRVRSETFHEIVEETTPKQKILMYNFRQFFNYTSQAALKIANTCIGNLSVSVLSINIQLILKKLKKLNAPSRQLEYILSLLTCWVLGCKAHESMFEYTKELLQLNLPAIKANIGIVGVENAISFTLPNSKSFYEISPYISAMVMSAGYALTEGLSQFLGSAVRKNSRIVSGHLISPVHSPDLFRVPFLPILAFQSFFGIFTSRFILQDNIVYIELKSKYKLLDSLYSILHEQNSAKKAEVHIGIMEALCTTLIGNSITELKTVKKDIIPQVLKNLRAMLKSDNPGYYITAAGMLGRGMEVFRSELSSEEVKDIVEELVLYGCKETQQYKQVFYKALISIASCNFIDFIEILAQEIENMDIDPLYPSSCIQVLDLFIEQKYDEVAAYLPAVIELIVRTLNPHNPILRKITIEKASHTLKTLILKLPMISFAQKQQRLAIGTMDSFVVVYDLKTASQWKLLKGHTGPICALDFDKSGDFLASFSSIDCSVKVWKLKSGFLQDLVGKNTSKPVREYKVECLDFQVSYKKFLDTVKLVWREDNKILLTREDGTKHVM